MAMIEELPVTATHRPSHGWAYVPDIKPQLQPLEARKRGARNAGAGGGGGGRVGGGELSAKQQKAIQVKLNQFDKENYRDTHVPVPTKSKDRGGGRKVTPNIRRVLTYQRSFVHYLADEEAQLAQYAGGSAGGGGNINSNNVTSTPSVLPQTLVSSHANSSRTFVSKQTPMQPPPRPASVRKNSLASSATASTASPLKLRESSSLPSQSSENPDIAAAAPSPPPPQSMNIDPHPSQSHAISTTTTPIIAYDKTALLHSRPHLKPPSSRLLQTLLLEPPLSYSGSRATAAAANSNNNDKATAANSTRPKPLRHFCTICGYWGKVRCKRCGERTCGLLDCFRGHGGICSVPAY